MREPCRALDGRGDDLGAERLFSGELFVFSTERQLSRPVRRCRPRWPRRRSRRTSRRAGHMPPRTTPRSSPTSSRDSSITREQGAHRHVLAELGCDVEKTYFDVPRLRTMAHGEYMKAGLALQFHPHRDTWFSAPYAAAELVAAGLRGRGRELDGIPPDYFDTPIENSSSGYDYDEWNRTGRQQAAQQITKDTRISRRPRRSSSSPGRPGRHAGRRRPGLLRGATPLDGAEHDRPNAIQHRLPHGQRRRPGRGRRSAERRLGVHGHDARRLRRASDLEPLPEDLIDRYRAGSGT